MVVVVVVVVVVVLMRGLPRPPGAHTRRRVRAQACSGSSSDAVGGDAGGGCGGAEWTVPLVPISRRAFALRRETAVRGARAGARCGRERDRVKHGARRCCSS